jgi:glyoxylase-like metal-dependent hydrolase (beta-lactamase superfamily II)
MACRCCYPANRAHQPDPKASTYTFSVGDFTLHMLTDFGAYADAAWMFPSLSPDDIGAFPDGKVVLSYGCTLVQANGRTILLDSSLGCVHPPIKRPQVMSQARPLADLRELFKAVGVAPKDVDVVVHTHLHHDHTSWNVLPGADGQLVPTFPNAKHYIQRAEARYWSSTAELRERVAYDTNVLPIEEAGMVELIDGAHDICEGITLELAPGHTPGHQVVRLASGGECGYFVGDAIHQVQQVARPSWSPVFDWSPADLGAAAMREALLARIEAEGALLISPHFPFPGVGRVLREGGAARRSFVVDDRCLLCE